MESGSGGTGKNLPSSNSPTPLSSRLKIFPVLINNSSTAVIPDLAPSGAFGLFPDFPRHSREQQSCFCSRIQDEQPANNRACQ
jgi:hypothetical protein